MVNDGEISLLGSRETPPSPQPAMFYSIVTLETCYASDVFRIFHHPNQLKQNPFWMTRFGSEPWGCVRARGETTPGSSPSPCCRCHRGAPFNLCTRCSHRWTGARDAGPCRACGIQTRITTYPLVNVYITMENHHFSWEISLFRLGHFQQQTVKLPEGIHGVRITTNILCHGNPRS